MGNDQDVHNTQDAFWLIEKVEQRSGDMFTFTGWVAYNEHAARETTQNPVLSKKVSGIIVKNRVVMITPSQRDDVRQIIPDLSDYRIGVEFTVHRSELNDQVTILFSDGTSAANIGTLQYWVMRNAKFNKNTKKGIIVVDNFYEDPDAIRKFAMENLRFEPSGYHKGQRSIDRFIVNGTKERFEEILGKEIINWNHPNYANGRFQFCTSADPIVYHVDTQTYAAMVYLTPNAPLRTGTATYRSKITGATRFDSMDENPDLFHRTFKGISKERNFLDGTTYEPVDDMANVYNRLVMFDSKTIHAATGYFGDAIENARFFQLFFFDVKW